MVIGGLIKVFDIMFTPIIKMVVGVLGVLWTGVKAIVHVLAGFLDIVQDVGSFFEDLMDQLLFAIGKLTKGLAGISETEYAERKAASDQRKKDRAEERSLRKFSNDDAAKAQAEGLQKDNAQFKEKKLTHDKLTGAAKKEAEAKEAAVKAQEKLLDYSAGPEELLKQFSAKEKGAVEAQVKGEKPSSTVSTVSTSVKALEVDAEKKKQQETAAKEKADAEAKAKADAEAKTKEEQNKKSQESPSTLLAELNTKMEQLIKHAAVTQSNTYETFNATKGLNKNLYKA